MHVYENEVLKVPSIRKEKRNLLSKPVHVILINEDC